ncbi:MAG: hypothetical protein O2931_05495, partial [Planctomycetota bacterium]|nr:hypothetical protein [Planctomycetota bacterium]
IQLAANETAQSPSSRRNAVERLELIRKSVIIDGETTPADLLPSSAIPSRSVSSAPNGLSQAGQPPVESSLPAPSGIRSVMTGARTLSLPTDPAANDSTPVGRADLGPTASLPRADFSSSAIPLPAKKPQAFADESMEDITEPPIVDRGTSHGAATQADPAMAPRGNPMRTLAAPVTGKSEANTNTATPLESLETESIQEDSVAPSVESPLGENSVDVTEGLPSAADSQPAATDPAASAAVETKQEVPADEALISSEIPALSFSTHGPRTIVVGKPARYLVRMLNSSGVTADNMDVKVQLPAWADVLKSHVTSGAAHQEPTEDDKSVIRWQLERIEARHSETLEITLVPRSSQAFELGVGWSFAPTRGITQIQVQEPRLDLSVLGQREVLFGDKKVYTLTVSNPGTGDAENVTLQLLPIVATDRTGAVRKLGTLKPGGREIIELELTARQAGALEVKAIAAADGDLSVTASQEVMVRRANLEVTLEGPATKYAGTPTRYTIHVENNGDATAMDVVAVVRIPGGSRDVTASRGGQWDEAQGMVHWKIGPMQAGEAKELSVQCDLLNAGENRFEARANGAGDLAATQSLVTTVEALADLKLFVNDPKGVVPVGADAVYEVRIINRGTRAAEDIQLVGYFSEGIEPTSIEGWRGQIEDGQVVLQPIRRLQAGQEMVVKITARATREANHVFRAELDCADPETRLATEEWTRYFGEVNSEPENDADQNGIATDAQHKPEVRIRR